ncbi:zinc finger BED domain-containing protein RICESLEEPER 2-like [Silene latifolia]|uniref:zinc finger BED domain-containing protein RICESLEEPER 2-like n=1 Tax=Silene latifolia TaxID=37657 RepID=UPI003D7883A7
MSTPKRIENFEESSKYLGGSHTKRLVLDCKTRWNSTFYMLESALPYKDVFIRLKRLNRKMKFYIPSEDDWKMAKIICDELDIFNTTTKVFSGRNYPNFNLFFCKACEIKLALKDWLKDDAVFVKSMDANMIEKFDKCWEHVNGLLAIASILDPRNKMDCVQYYFDIIYGSRCDREVEKVRGLLDDLVVEYQEKGEGSKTPNKMSKRKGKKNAFCLFR